MTNFEKAQLILQTVTTAAIIIGAVFAGWQLRLLRIGHIDSYDWNRRKAAQDTALLFKQRVDSTMDLESAFNYIDRTDTIPLQEIMDVFASEEHKKLGLRTQLHRVLNYYEGLARGVTTGIYDEGIIRTSWGNAMSRMSYKFRAYIEERRRTSSPGAWSQLDRLVKRWDEDEKAKRDLSTHYTKIANNK